jgi:hypothetical protein
MKLAGWKICLLLAAFATCTHAIAGSTRSMQDSQQSRQDTPPAADSTDRCHYLAINKVNIPERGGSHHPFGTLPGQPVNLLCFVEVNGLRIFFYWEQDPNKSTLAQPSITHTNQCNGFRSPVPVPSKDWRNGCVITVFSPAQNLACDCNKLGCRTHLNLTRHKQDSSDGPSHQSF